MDKEKNVQGILQGALNSILERDDIKKLFLRKIILPIAMLVSFFGIVIPSLMLDEIGDFSTWVPREIEVVESNITIKEHSAVIKGSYKLTIMIRDIQLNKLTTNIRVSFGQQETSEWYFDESDKHKAQYENIQKQYPVGKVFTAYATKDLEKYFFEKPDVFIINLFLYVSILTFLFLVALKVYLGRKSS